MQHKIYIRSFFIILTILSAILTALHVVVDPQGILQAFVMDGLNNKVVKEGSKDRLVNGISLYVNDYDAILVGTSRVQSGIDPRSDAFEGKRVYNASLGDTDIVELSYELDYILKHQPNVKELYIGLDIHAFSAYRGLNSQFQESPLNPENYPLLHLLRFNFSHERILESYRMIKANIGGDTERYWVRGHYHSDAHIDHKVMIEYILRVYTSHRALFGCFKYDKNKLARLKESLTEIAQAGIKIFLFISPQHAKNMLIFEYLDVFDEYFQWIRDLEFMSRSINEIAPESSVLWNFSGFNSVTLEPIVYGEKQMENYFETSHYRVNIGERIITTMSSNTDHTDFGELIDNNSVDSIALRIREGMSAYINDNPDDVADFEQILDETESQRNTNACSV